MSTPDRGSIASRSEGGIATPHTATSERSIRVLASPTAGSAAKDWTPTPVSFPAPGESAVTPSPRPPKSGGRPPAAPVSPGSPANEGVVGKVLGWLDAGTSPSNSAFGGNGASPSLRMGRAPSGGVPEFTALTEDPDTRRRKVLQQHQKSQRKQIAEEKWRAECLAVAKTRRLQHVADMRLLWISKSQHRSGAAVLVVVGAHYRPKIASLEDIMLYAVLEFEKLAGRPYVVLFFNADAPMRALPHTMWFQELHAALPVSHRQQLQAIYCVHPASHWPATRAWLYLLKLQIPEVYDKVKLAYSLERLLQAEFDAGLRREVPQLVLDYCGRHPGT